MTAPPRRHSPSCRRVRVNECDLRQNANANDRGYDCGHEQNASAKPRHRRVDVESPARGESYRQSLRLSGQEKAEFERVCCETSVSVYPVPENFPIQANVGSEISNYFATRSRAQTSPNRSIDGTTERLHSTIH